MNEVRDVICWVSPKGVMAPTALPTEMESAFGTNLPPQKNTPRRQIFNEKKEAYNWERDLCLCGRGKKKV
jgi:hypothetical protein